MKCPDCGRRMRVTTTYQADGLATTQRLECSVTNDGCGMIASTLSIIVSQGRGNVPAGESAYSIAKRVRQGEDPKTLITER